MTDTHKAQILKLRTELQQAEDAWLTATTNARNAQAIAEKARQSLFNAQTSYTTYLSLVVEIGEGQ